MNYPEQYAESRRREAEAALYAPAFLSLHKRVVYGDGGYGEPFVETSVSQHSTEELARQAGGIVYKLV